MAGGPSPLPGGGTSHGGLGEPRTLWDRAAAKTGDRGVTLGGTGGPQAGWCLEQPRELGPSTAWRRTDPVPSPLFQGCPSAWDTRTCTEGSWTESSPGCSGILWKHRDVYLIIVHWLFFLLLWSLWFPLLCQIQLSLPRTNISHPFPFPFFFPLFPSFFPFSLLCSFSFPFPLPFPFSLLFSLFFFPLSPSSPFPCSLLFSPFSIPFSPSFSLSFFFSPSSLLPFLSPLTPHHLPEG